MRQEFRAFWLDADGNDVAEIDLVESGAGSLQFNTNADSKLGGSLRVRDVPSWVNPLLHRVRVEAVLDGEIMRLGSYLIDMEDVAYTRRSRSHDVTLLDQLQVPRQDLLVGPLAFGAGHNIIEAAVSVLAGAGESRTAVTPSAAVLATPLVWEPGTTRLQVINDLLAAAGYWGLRTDSQGRFAFAPYILPEARPIVREFVAGEGSLVKADYSKSHNYSGIPNRFIAVSGEYDTGDDDTFEGLVGVADLTNPKSPFAAVNRGGRVVAQSERV